METLGAAIQNWMEAYKIHSVRESTYDRLLTSLDLMKRYSVYECDVSELDSDDIQAYVNLLVRDGYALSTIRKQYHLIGAYLSHANAIGLVPRLAHKGVELPSKSSVVKREKQVHAYTEEEQDRLRTTLQPLEHPAYGAVLLMLETGMRIGEVLALGWDDIDWRRRAVRIHKTMVRLGNHSKQYVREEAKSYSSNRTIPLSVRAQELLRNLLRQPSDGGFIIHDRLGNPLSYEAVRWQTRKACEKAHIPYYGQHVFRHTFATNCYHRGCDVKVLSKLLGHSDVTITYNVYIHLFGDALEEMRAIVG